MMIYTNAVFSHKNNNFEPQACVVEKVIRLSGAEYDRFARNMQRDWDFISDNADLMHRDADGKRHCLLVVSDERRDGILVESQGYDYARYAAFVPYAEGLLTVGQYPALASLTRNLAEVVEYLAEEYGTDERSAVDLRDLETMFGIDLMTNGALLNTVTDMLGERLEIKDFELDKNELIIYGEPDREAPIEDLSDPSVTKEDMYAHGYGYENMIPLGRDRALELFDKGYEIHRLYVRGFELPANGRHDIEVFDGMFGVIDPALGKDVRPLSIEVFIVNRAGYENNNIIGEWLTLPAKAETLRGLLDQIDIDTPSEGAFTIAAVRVPYDCMRNYVTKYDGLDVLNMLASYMNDMEDFELDKFQAILTSNVMDIGSGAAALINLLDRDNFDAFNLIDANDAESLGRYYDAENDEKPDGVSLEQYGYQCIKEENGVFTEHGYICCRYGELSQEYNGIVPDEYKIVGAALQGLRSKQAERGADEKPSVIEKITAARQAPRVPKDKDTQKYKKSKEGQDL